MDIQRPIPRQKLRADWGRAVADAVRAQGLDGPGVLRTPGGTSLPPVQPPGVAQRTEPPPWAVLAAWDALAADGDGDWVLRVIHGGPVTLGGVPVPAPTPTGSYADDRPGYTDVSRTAFGSTFGFLVVEASTSAQAWSLRRDVDASGDGFRAVASVSWASGEAPVITQLHHGPLELVAGGGASAGPDSDAVAKVLGGTDYNAAEDTWEYGETAEVPVDPEDPEGDTVAKPTYPVYNPTRLYWQESVHTLWMFRRTETYNSSGLLVAVSAEVRTAVFVTVAEMP